MDIKAITQLLRDKGHVSLKDNQGKIIELIAHDKWDSYADGGDGIFLLFDLFQIRSIAMPFSDVSLDIVEFSTKPVIYYTSANRNLADAPIVNGQIKFAMIRDSNWNKLLFTYGKLLICQAITDDRKADFEVLDRLPLSGQGVIEMFLGPEGQVKILKG